MNIDAHSFGPTILILLFIYIYIEVYLYVYSYFQTPVLSYFQGSSYPLGKSMRYLGLTLPTPMFMRDNGCPVRRPNLE